ncbi:MAG: metalloregulator ArsR/SmtB family transcription factor [Candidatus Micrarchaeia archaeon]
MENQTVRLFFDAFGDINRFNILLLLLKKPLNVSSIAKLTALEQSNVSHHMKCLTNCGFVNVKKVGKEHTYSIEPAAARMVEGVVSHMGRYEEHLHTCGIIAKRGRSNRYTK